MKYKRIYIIGTSGSGKTFFANQISKKLKIKYYDLDDFYWIKKYTKKRTEDKRRDLAKKLSNKQKWIAEGIFGSWAIDLIKKADLVIWVQTPAYLRTIRILKRNFSRENEKLIDSLKLAKYSLTYRFGKHTQSYKSHKKLFEKNKINPLIIKNKIKMEKFLGEIK
jgi:adenylate kinase family enzyme